MIDLHPKMFVSTVADSSHDSTSFKMQNMFAAIEQSLLPLDVRIRIFSCTFVINLSTLLSKLEKFNVCATKSTMNGLIITFD